jgi:hypothetical protein
MHPSPIPKSRVHMLAARIHDLGPRPLAEMFIELLAGADPHDTLERYARPSPLAEFIAAHGGDPPPTARSVR